MILPTQKEAPREAQSHTHTHTYTHTHTLLRTTWELNAKQILNHFWNGNIHIHFPNEMYLFAWQDYSTTPTDQRHQSQPVPKVLAPPAANSARQSPQRFWNPILQKCTPKPTNFGWKLMNIGTFEHESSINSSQGTKLLLFGEGNVAMKSPFQDARAELQKDLQSVKSERLFSSNRSAYLHLPGWDWVFHGFLEGLKAYGLCIGIWSTNPQTQTKRQTVWKLIYQPESTVSTCFNVFELCTSSPAGSKSKAWEIPQTVNLLFEDHCKVITDNIHNLHNITL